MTINPDKFHLAIVGSGPVGLWTAVQAKLQNPDIEVIVLDKDDQFNRTHSLYLEAQSLRTECKSPELQEIIKKFKFQSPLPIETIVTSLKELAEKIGIVFQNNFKVVNPDVDLAPFKNLQVVVGADGAYSCIREKVVGEKASQCFEKQQDLHYIVDLTYHEERVPVNTFSKMSMNSEVGNCIYEIHSKKKKRTTLRTFVSKEVHDKIKSMSRRQGADGNRLPVTIDSPELDEAVKNEFRTFLNAKYAGNAAKYIDLDKATLSTTMLGAYISKKIVKIEDKVAWALVGDAAFGMPFFRSLNNGFLSGTKLAKVIATNVAIEENFIKMAPRMDFARYENFVKNLASKQFFLARVKSFFINCWISIAKTFHSVPSPKYLLKTAPVKSLHSKVKKAAEGSMARTSVKMEKTKAAMTKMWTSSKKASAS